MRLDKYLFEKKIVTSRNKAAELIKKGKIKVDGKVVLKPSYNIDNLDCKIELLEEKLYVSRAAYKLKYFLEDNQISVKNFICLDIGSSTGGFSQILLEKGAKEIYAVDVGKDQLHESLKNNPKIKSFENTDIRNFKINKTFDLVICDVSFMGIKHILKDIDRFAKNKIILLFKPQFEVGKEAKRDKKGVVKDKEAILKAYERFEEDIKKFGWKTLLKEESKVKGKEGNVETFYYFEKR